MDGLATDKDSRSRRRHASRRADAAKRPRWLLISIGAVVLAVIAIAIRLFVFTDAPVHAHATVISYTANATSITVTLEVYKPAGESDMCIVRAVSSTGAVVGFDSVDVPTGLSEQRVVHTMNTTVPAASVQVVSCFNEFIPSQQ